MYDSVIDRECETENDEETEIMYALSFVSVLEFGFALAANNSHTNEFQN